MVEARSSAITEPFPNGESYEQVMERIGGFLADLGETHDGQTILIVGHSATYWGLRHHVQGIPLVDAMQEAASFTRFEMESTKTV